jgi:hypothetical protein
MPVSITPIHLLPPYLNDESRDQATRRLETSVREGKHKLNGLANEGANWKGLQKAHHAIQLARVRQIDNNVMPTLSLPPRKNVN